MDRRSRAYARKNVDAMLEAGMDPAVHKDGLDELLGGLLEVIDGEAIRRGSSKAPGGVEIVSDRREISRDHRISGHRSASLRRPPCARASPHGRAPLRTRSGARGS